MKADLVVRNANLVLPEIGPLQASLIVTNGRVLSLSRPGKEPDAAEVIDVGGRVVIPGLIDPHIHIGTLTPLKERMLAESAFGIAGGVTTFIRYFRRPESYLGLLDEQIDLCENLFYQDFAIHPVLHNSTHVAELEQYVEGYGITSFKVYMNLRGKIGRGFLMDLRPEEKGPKRYDVEFDMGLLHEIFQTAAIIPTRIRLCVHAEDGEIVNQSIERARRMGVEGLAGWHFACPALAEALAIHQVALLAKEYGVPVYFPHIGSKAALGALSELHADGIDFLAETGIHYLTQTTASSAGLLAKVMPPIRTDQDRDAIWYALEDGLIRTIGSDHVGLTLAEKNVGDIWTTRPAFAGTGIILPVLLSEGVKKKRMSLQQLAQITSCNAAKAFGLYPRKGTLLPGADADFVVVDPDHSWTIHARELWSASDFSIFEGMKVYGRIMTVFVRGQKVLDEGQLVAQPGHGQYLARGGH